MRVIFAGSGEFGVPTLAALRDAGHDLPLVVSQPDRPAGRGRKLCPTPAAQFALDHGLPLLRTDDINAQPLPDADLMVVIAFGQKIGQAVLRRPTFGGINLHASVLPKYRGAAPINWAILRQETVTGNSVIRLADRMDAGAVLGQSRVKIGPVETAGELHDRLSRDGVGVVLRVIQALADGSHVETPQDESLATAAPKLSRQEAALDWSAPAPLLAARIRGLYPWPGCRVRLLDAAGGEVGRLTLVRTAIAPSEGSRWRPGEVMTDGFVNVDGTDALQVIEVQPEGRRPMPLEDYRRGNPWQAGLRLESIVPS